MRKLCHLDHSAESDSKTRLLIREWVLILGVFGLVASLLIISHFSKIREDQKLQTCIEQAKQAIAITLTGAVQSPGTYEVKPGTTLKDLLKDVPISANAERKKVPFKKVFYSSQDIHIPYKKKAIPKG